MSNYTLTVVDNDYTINMTPLEYAVEIQQAGAAGLTGAN